MSNQTTSSDPIGLSIVNVTAQMVVRDGVLTIYPPENGRLSEQIVERGALITDYPLGTVPRADFFPRRNRIMSGVALGTLIVDGQVATAPSSPYRLQPTGVPGSIFRPPLHRA